MLKYRLSPIEILSYSLAYLLLILAAPIAVAAEIVSWAVGKAAGIDGADESDAYWYAGREEERDETYLGSLFRQFGWTKSVASASDSEAHSLL